jgi:hypothetical protein
MQGFYNQEVTGFSKSFPTIEMINICKAATGNDFLKK